MKCITCDTNEVWGTDHCNGCWEIQCHLAGYLRRGGHKARHFVEEALAKARLDIVIETGRFER